jgi:hypothetical protein
MFGSGDRRNATTFAEILHLLVILFLVGVAYTILRQ